MRVFGEIDIHIVHWKNGKGVHEDIRLFDVDIGMVGLNRISLTGGTLNLRRAIGTGKFNKKGKLVKRTGKGEAKYIQVMFPEWYGHCILGESLRNLRSANDMKENRKY